MSALTEAIIEGLRAWGSSQPAGARGRVLLSRLPLVEGEWKRLAQQLVDETRPQPVTFHGPGGDETVLALSESKTIVVFAFTELPPDLPTWPPQLVVTEDFAVTLRDAVGLRNHELADYNIIYLLDKVIDSLLQTTSQLTERGAVLDPAALLQVIAPSNTAELGVIISQITEPLQAALRDPHRSIRLQNVAERWHDAPPLPSQAPADLLGWFQDPELDSMVQGGNLEKLRDRLEQNRRLAERYEQLRATEADDAEWAEAFPQLAVGQLRQLKEKGPSAIRFDDAAKKPSPEKFDDFRGARGAGIIKTKKKGTLHVLVSDGQELSVTLDYTAPAASTPMRLWIDGEEKTWNADHGFVTVQGSQIKLKLPPAPAGRHVVLHSYWNKATNRGKLPPQAVRVLQLPSGTPPLMISEFEIGDHTERCVILDTATGRVIETPRARVTRNHEAGPAYAPERPFLLPVEIRAGPSEPTEWLLAEGDNQFRLPIACRPSQATEDVAQAFRGALVASATKNVAYWCLEPEGRAIRSPDSEERITLSPAVQDDLRQEKQWVEQRWLTPRDGSHGGREETLPPAQITHLETYQNVRAAYDAMFEWLASKSTLPSLVGPHASEYWALVDRAVDAIAAFANEKQGNARTRLTWLSHIGCVVQGTEIRVSGPFWPPALSASSHIAALVREGHLVPHSVESEFITPSALVPLNLVTPGNSRYAFADPRALGTWLDWNPVDMEADRPYAGMGRILRTRLDQFLDAFPQLTGPEIPSPVKVRIIRGVPEKNFVEQLERFLLEASEDGRWTEEHRLDIELVLNAPHATTALDARLDPANADVDPDTGVDLLQTCVRLRKVPLGVLFAPPAEWERYAHLTLVSGETAFDARAPEADQLAPSAVVGGLMPSFHTDLSPSRASEPSMYGSGSRDQPAASHQSFTRLWNHALTTVAGQGEFRTPFRAPAVRPRGRLEETPLDLGLDSIWTVHIDPGVGLLPLTGTWSGRPNRDSGVLVHFTTVADPTSPGYSDVTVTERVRDLGQALERSGRRVGIGDARSLLPVLNSLNGEWLLKVIQTQKRESDVRALLSCAKAAHRVLDQLRQQKPDTLWIVAGWEDYHVVTHATGKTKGEAGFTADGKGSDDILVIGIPRAMGAKKVRILILESKFGTSPTAKGYEQIDRTHTALHESLAREGLRGRLNRSRLGHYILRAAERLAVHDVLAPADREWLEEHQLPLREGEYELEHEPTAGLPEKGFLVHVDPDCAVETTKRQQGVMQITLPSGAPVLRPQVEEPRGPVARTAAEATTVAPTAGPEADSPVPQAAPGETPTQPPAETAFRPEPKAKPSGWAGSILRRLPSVGVPPPPKPRDELYALDRILRQFNIEADPPEPEDVIAGPQATAVHLRLAVGTSVNKLRNSLEAIQVALHSTKALSLSTTERPGAVSLFVPHEERVPIPLLSLLGDIPIEGMSLPTTVGIASNGEMLWTDLKETNHLLVAGATGSGKTVYLRGAILSLMTAFEPSRLYIHIIDPKQLDFSRFRNAPHLRAPPIHTTAEALVLLERLLLEIERRRHILAEEGVSDIYEHNRAEGAEQLPYHVVLIDEYNQLRLSAEDEQSAELERRVCQLAQIGRAFGIYLIVATQRPSVEVITGDIKANFPTRMSFRVASSVDSRVILDQDGAERLLPKGDGLLTDPSGRTVRFQALYNDQQSVEALINAMREEWRARAGTPKE